MNKIIKSLSVIVFVGAIALSLTGAYFSDTETSTGNIITAGSLDLTLNGVNGEPVTAVVIIEDMKPSQTWYSGPITLEVFDNPGRIYKHIVRDGCYPMTCTGGDSTEPECEAEGGVWTDYPNGGYCDSPNNVRNYLPEVTWFDLEVWVGNPINAVSGPDAPMCGTDDPSGVPITNDCWDILIADGDALIDDTGIFGSSVDYVLSKWIYLGTYGYPQMTNKIIIRQSFHMDGPFAGNEYQGDTCTFAEEFMVLQTNAPHPDPVYIPSQNVTLDSINVGDSDSVSMVSHDAQMWFDDPRIGGYGGDDGGSATFAMVGGDDDGNGTCDADENDATFEMDAGTETAKKLVIRHLDGLADDSFNVYVGGVFIGSYAYSGNTAEFWVTTTFDLGANAFTGKETIRLEMTNYPWSFSWGGCSDYGQGAVNWAKITN